MERSEHSIFDQVYFYLWDHPQTDLPLIFPDQKLAIFWSAKCACTTLRLWYLQQVGLVTNERLARWKNSPEKGKADILTLIQMIKTYQRSLSFFSARKDLAHYISHGSSQAWTIIKFTRNPAERSVSAFLQILKYRALLPNPKERDIPFTFRDFMALPDHYFHISGNKHIRPQTTYLEQSGLLQPDRIIHIEDNVHGALAEIEKEFNLKAISDTLKSRNVRKVAVQTSITENRLSADMELTASDFENSTRLPSNSDFLDSNIQSRISYLFHSDYERYDYKLPELSKKDQCHKWIEKARSSDRYRTLAETLLLEEPLDYPVNQYRALLSRVKNNQALIVYGISNITEDLYYHHRLDEKNIIAVSSRAPKEEARHHPLFSFINWPLIEKEEIVGTNFDYILVVAKAASAKIAEELQALGVPKSKILYISGL